MWLFEPSGSTVGRFGRRPTISVRPAMMPDIFVSGLNLRTVVEVRRHGTEDIWRLTAGGANIAPMAGCGKLSCSFS